MGKSEARQGRVLVALKEQGWHPFSPQAGLGVETGAPSGQPSSKAEGS